MKLYDGFSTTESTESTGSKEGSSYPEFLSISVCSLCAAWAILEQAEIVKLSRKASALWLDVLLRSITKNLHGPPCSTCNKPTANNSFHPTSGAACFSPELTLGIRPSVG